MVSSPLYLYNKGTWSNGISDFYCIYHTGRMGDYTKNETYYYSFVIQYCDKGDITVYRTNNPILLTEYSSIKITLSCSEYLSPVYFGISPNGALTSTNYTASTSVLGGVSSGVYSIATSSLSGSYYIYIYIVSNRFISSSSSNIWSLTMSTLYLS